MSLSPSMVFVCGEKASSKDSQPPSRCKDVHISCLCQCPKDKVNALFQTICILEFIFQHDKLLYCKHCEFEIFIAAIINTVSKLGLKVNTV